MSRLSYSKSMTQKRNRLDAQKVVLDSIRDVGVGDGDTVFLGVDMGMIPLPHIEIAMTRNAIERRREALCEFVFKTIKNVIGEYGTIIVPTYSYSCARPGSVFIHESTPSEIGPFTEYVRRLPGSKRSIHPIFSVSAIGHRAAELTEDCGGAAFGECSPFARLSSFGAKFLNLGVPLHCSLTYVHHLEQSYGCSHRYNKHLNTKVIVNGIESPHRYMAYLRFRGVKADVSLLRFEQLLLSRGVLRQKRVDDAIFQSVLAVDVDALGYSSLKRDTTFFLPSDVVIQLDDKQVRDLSLDAQEVTFTLDVI